MGGVSSGTKIVVVRRKPRTLLAGNVAVNKIRGPRVMSMQFTFAIFVSFVDADAFTNEIL
jgi:hypothetical protein